MPVKPSYIGNHASDAEKRRKMKSLSYINENGSKHKNMYKQKTVNNFHHNGNT